MNRRRAWLLLRSTRVLSLQIFPADSVLPAQRMRVRQDDEHAFAPELCDVAIALGRLSHDEDDVELFRA